MALRSDEAASLKNEVEGYGNQAEASKFGVLKAQRKLAEANAAGDTAAATRWQESLDFNRQNIIDNEAKKAEGEKQLAEYNNQPTTPSAKDAETAQKYEDPTNVPDPATATPSADPANPNAPTIEQTNNSVLSTVTGSSADDKKASRLPPTIPPGADSTNKKPVSAAWAGAKDLRVFLRVPTVYLEGPSTDKIGFPLLRDLGGIMFPYTPQISYESAASYTAVNPVHSNFTQNFYKNSSVGNITISGKFTVQNEKEGAIYCAVIHLLRSLTKMRFGNEPNAGSPPPVCRLDAFGDYMLSNVPVVITSIKFDLPDNVDYIQVPMYKTTLVPTISTITLGLAIMYSRQEMQDFTVRDWRSGSLKGQGYL
jgi:hypothetical protein